MIINYFTFVQRKLRQHDKRLTEHWPVPYYVYKTIEAWYNRFGPPSRIYKYNDYCAIHYTFLVDTTDTAALNKTFALQDYLAIFFPTEEQIDTFMWASKKVYEALPSKPKFMGELQTAIEEMDLSDHYENLDKSGFKSLMGLRNRGDKVVYDSYNTPKMPTPKFAYVDDKPIRGATQDNRVYDDMSFGALGQDLFNFHGIGGESDE